MNAISVNAKHSSTEWLDLLRQRFDYFWCVRALRRAGWYGQLQHNEQPLHPQLQQLRGQRQACGASATSGLQVQAGKRPGKAPWRSGRQMIQSMIMMLQLLVPQRLVPVLQVCRNLLFYNSKEILVGDCHSESSLSPSSPLLLLSFFSYLRHMLKKCRERCLSPQQELHMVTVDLGVCA